MNEIPDEAFVPWTDADRAADFGDLLAPRLQNAEIEYEPYASEDPNEPDWAPYVRLATCDAHGLEAVTGHKIIPTGPGDLCDVGTFACGKIVGEDVF